MKDQCYLILNSRGIIGFKKKAPPLKGDERAILVNVEVPDNFFEYTFVRRDVIITDEDYLDEPDVKVEVAHAAKKL